MSPLIRCFTTKYSGLANVLKTDVHIAKAFNPQDTKDHPPVKNFTCIWDTGATHTAISQKVIDECDLEPIGMTIVQTADGAAPKNRYLVNIVLPNKVGFINVVVTEAILGQDVDVLIGMDIISQGDFAVTNKDKKTSFTFRVGF